MLGLAADGVPDLEAAQSEGAAIHSQRREHLLREKLRERPLRDAQHDFRSKQYAHALVVILRSWWKKQRRGDCSAHKIRQRSVTPAQGGVVRQLVRQSGSVSEKLLDRDLLARTLGKLRNELHHRVRQSQFTAVREDHHPRGGHCLRDGGKEENRVRIRRLPKRALEYFVPSPRVQHRGLENSRINLSLKYLSCCFHGVRFGVFGAKNTS